VFTEAVSALAEGSEERAQAFIELSEHVPPLLFEELFMETDSSTEIWTCEVRQRHAPRSRVLPGSRYTGSEFANMSMQPFSGLLCDERNQRMIMALVYGAAGSMSLIPV
jgi:hypothetical protein